jgi:hypothetical protein
MNPHSLVHVPVDLLRDSVAQPEHASCGERNERWVAVAVTLFIAVCAGIACLWA